MSLIKFLHYTTAIGVEVAHLSYWRIGGLSWFKYINNKTPQDTLQDRRKPYSPKGLDCIRRQDTTFLTFPCISFIRSTLFHTVLFIYFLYKIGVLLSCKVM